MPDDVYRPPSSDLTREPVAPSLAEPAPFSLATAIGDGWRAMISSFPLWLGIGLLYYLLVIASIATLLGIVLLVPVLTWGLFSAALNMFDGRGRTADLFGGFMRYGRALGHMLGLGLLIFGIALPGMAAQIVLQGEQTATGLALSYAVGLAWNVVTIRFALAWLFSVEHGTGPVESLRASWRYTRGQWGRLILFLAATFGISILGLAVLLIGIVPASVIIGFAYVSIYRQITRTRVEPA